MIDPLVAVASIIGIVLVDLGLAFAVVELLHYITGAEGMVLNIFVAIGPEESADLSAVVPAEVPSSKSAIWEHERHLPGMLETDYTR